MAHSPVAGRGRVCLPHARDTDELFASGADLVLEPIQDAADRAVELLCGAQGEKWTGIHSIETEEKQGH